MWESKRRVKKKLTDYMSDTFKVFGHFHVIKQNVKAYAVHVVSVSQTVVMNRKGNYMCKFKV